MRTVSNRFWALMDNTRLSQAVFWMWGASLREKILHILFARGREVVKRNVEKGLRMIEPLGEAFEHGRPLPDGRELTNGGD